MIAERWKALEQSISEKEIKVNGMASEQLGEVSRVQYAFLDSWLLIRLQKGTEFTEKDVRE